ncbi:3671_t:CDS:2, partial [Funneliformis mosseae]
AIAHVGRTLIKHTLILATHGLIIRFVLKNIVIVSKGAYFDIEYAFRTNCYARHSSHRRNNTSAALPEGSIPMNKKQDMELGFSTALKIHRVEFDLLATYEIFSIIIEEVGIE